MGKFHHGYRSRTRNLMRKNVRDRGLPGLSRFMIEYDIGDKVNIIGDPSFQKGGLPHRRFWGKNGLIVSKRGRCYEVHIKEGSKIKKIFLSKAHIRPDKSWLMEKSSQQTQE